MPRVRREARQPRPLRFVAALRCQVSKAVGDAKSCGDHKQAHAYQPTLARHRVKRDAEFISLSTVNLLDPDVCEDVTCRQLLRTKYNEEVRLEKEEEDRIRKAREEKEQKERDAERRRMIELARLNKQNAHLERELYEEHLRIEDMKMKKREEAKRRRQRILEEKKNENGSWKKVRRQR